MLNNTNNTNTFANLIASVNTSPKNAQAINNLAIACSYSMLNKCINTGGQVKYLSNLKAQVYNYHRVLASVDYVNTFYSLYNDDKPITATTTSFDYEQGADLVQTACLAILEKIAEQQARGQAVNLEKSYEYEKLDKFVYINFDKPTTENIILVSTTPIQQVYREMRRYIDGEAKRTSDSVYTYTLEEAELNGILYTYYARNKTHSATQADYTELINLANKMLSDIGATPTQQNYVKDRLQGLSLSQIAVKHKVSKPTVTIQFKRLQEKYNAYNLSVLKTRIASVTNNFTDELAMKAIFG